MTARIIVLHVAFVILSVALCGCGGSGPAPPEPPVQPTESVHVFKVDFDRGTITVLERRVDGVAIVDSDPGGTSPELKVNLTLIGSVAGNPGWRRVKATVTNNSMTTIGQTPEGTVVGLDLVFTSLRFQTAAGALVEGGGMAGWDAHTPVTELPVYHIQQAVKRNSTSSAARLNFLLPTNATTAVFGLIVRANTEDSAPPAFADRYVTTIAGYPTSNGVVDGPYNVARFLHPSGLCCRGTAGDLLVADAGSDRIRRLYAGQVSTFVGGGYGSYPCDLAEDVEGNIVVLFHDSNQLALAPPGGGSAVPIAGTGDEGARDGRGNVAEFFNPEGICVVGDRVYVAGGSDTTVRMVRYTGGDRFDPKSYYVSTWITGFYYPVDVAADYMGNLFIYDAAQVLRAPVGSATMSAIAGTLGSGGSTDGRGDRATLGSVRRLHVDQDGTIYFAERDGAVRKIRYTGGDPASATSYYVQTLVRNGTAVQDGPNNVARAFSPFGLTVGLDGVLWFTDGNCIRRLDRRVH